MFQSKKNIIAGRNPVLLAIREGKGVDKILLYRQASGEHIADIKAAAREKNIPLQMVPAEKLNSLTNVQHQGVVAFKSSIQYFDVQEVIDHVVEQGGTPLFLLLDGVTDVRNIGAITRSAVACGAQAIIIPDKGVAALGEDAMKASAGALELIHVCRVNSLMKTVDLLHLNGIRVYASEMKAKTRVYELPLAEPCAIVMGSEGKGVFEGLKKICDNAFCIPMTGDFESLNVSVATGIILYECMKQRLG
jgi:23S rRNA (guanosine2251-2'-O)-methyltransferase